MNGCPFFQQAQGGGDKTEEGVNKSNQFSVLGALATETGTLSSKAPELTHYSTYLCTDELLRLQDGRACGKPEGKNIVHREELTFIIVHQTFELWFKLIISDLRYSRDIVKQVLSKTESKTEGGLKEAIHYIFHAEQILKHCTGAFDVIELIHPLHFLEFRDCLLPASGFQSLQFRILEYILGLPNHARVLINDSSVISYLSEDEKKKLSDEEKEPSVNDLILEILSAVKVPDGFEASFLEATRKVLEEQQYVSLKATPGDPKTESFIASGVASVKSMLDDPAAWSDGLYFEKAEDGIRYRQAVHGGIFAMSYRNESAYADIASLMDALVAFESAVLLWRARHAQMAERMIGRRGGTGGTGSGVGYLSATREYRVFPSLWLIRKMLVRASALPAISLFSK